jgi:hypothetical protein
VRRLEKYVLSTLFVLTCTGVDIPSLTGDDEASEVRRTSLDIEDAPTTGRTKSTVPSASLSTSNTDRPLTRSFDKAKDVATLRSSQGEIASFLLPFFDSEKLILHRVCITCFEEYPSVVLERQGETPMLYLSDNLPEGRDQRIPEPFAQTQDQHGVRL